MNANQIINMVMRIVMRKVIGAGINKGMGRRMSKAGKSKQDLEARAQRSIGLVRFQARKCLDSFRP